MIALPEPLVPAECDLHGYEFMPLYGDRLFKSETWKKASFEARCAMLRLWWHAFAHETPSASLPDDDALLADYAGYGDAVKPWLKVRAQALRHWQKCSDGRLYDPVLADIAMEAWHVRVNASARGKAGASKKWERHRQAKAIAQASKTNGASNAHATKNDSKGSEVIRKEVEPSVINTSGDQGGEGQGLDISPSTPTRRRKAVEIAKSAAAKATGREQ